MIHRALFPSEIYLVCQDWKAVVLPAFGMNLIDIRYRDKPILKSPLDLADLQSNKWVRGMPLLFPAGRIPDGVFQADGVVYQMPVNEPMYHNHLHGSMHLREFTVLTQDRSTVSAMYENDHEAFPIPFRMIYGISLSAEGVLQQVRIQNTGTARLPVCFAFHSTFLEPEIIRVPIRGEWPLDERKRPTGDCIMPGELSRKLSSGFKPDGTAISGYYTLDRNTVRIGRFTYDFSDTYDRCVLYNGGGHQGFICVEPQQGLGLGLSKPLMLLARGGEVLFSSLIRAAGG